MAGQMTVLLRADPNQFESGIRAAEQAVDRFLKATEDGSDDVDQAFSDVIRKLVELGRASGRSTEDIRDDLGKLGLSAKDAEEAIEAIERETSDLGRNAGSDLRRVREDVEDIGTEAEDSADKTKRIGDSARDSGDGIRDLGDIARDTLSGDMSSAIDGVINLIGGIGIAGGVAAGALGVITTVMQQQQEEADRLKERLSNAYGEAAEAGRKYLDQAQITADVHDLMFNPDRAGEWKQLQEDANKLGIDRGTIYAANAGDLEAQRIVQEAINGLLQDESSTYETIRDGISRVQPEVQGIVDRWGDVIGQTNAAKAGTEEYAQFVSDAQQRARDQISRTADVAAARYQGLADQYGVPIKGRVVLDVDDSAVRRYNPPEIVIRTRMGAPKDMTWQ